MSARGLEIGREYTVTLVGSNVGSYRLHFAVDVDYVVFLNKLERNVMSASNLAAFTLAVFRKSDFDVRPFGSSSRLGASAVVWSVSLGSLANGRAAGHISINQENLDSSSMSISSVTCNPLSPEVERIPASGPIQQVYSNAGLVVLTPIVNGLEFSFYTRSQVSGALGGPYSASGNPVVKYVATRIDGSYSTKLQVDKIVGITTWRSTLTKSSYPYHPLLWELNDWYRLQDGPVTTESRDWFVGPNEVVKVSDASGTATSMVNRYVDTGIFGLQIASSEALGLSKQTSYYTTGLGSYRRRKSFVDVDGNWTLKTYCDDLVMRGMPARVYRPWLSAPASVPSNMPSGIPSTGDLTLLAYAWANWNGEQVRATSTERYKEGVQVGRTTVAYGYSFADGERVRSASIDEYADSTQKVSSTFKVFEDDCADAYLRGMPFAHVRADGVVEAYAYHRGWLDPTTKTFQVSSDGGARRVVRLTGSKHPSPGAVLITKFGPSGFERAIEPLYVLPNDSTFEETISGATSGNVVRRTINLVTSASAPGSIGFSRLEGSMYFYTGLGELSSVLDDGRGYVYLSTWVDGKRTSEKDEAWATTSFTYDAADRLSSMTREGGTGGPPSETTTFRYDAAGRMTGAWRGGVPEIREEWSYDQGGRLIRHSVPGQTGSSTTEYVYTDGGKTITETYADNGTRVSVRHLEGTPVSMTGTAVVPVYTQTKVNSDGSIESREQRSSGVADGVGWKKQRVDWLGRVVLSWEPSRESGATNGTQFRWSDINGQLAWKRPADAAGSPMGASTAFAYDAMGRVFRTWLNVDDNHDAAGNPVVDLAGTDRVSEFAYGFVSDGGQRWYRIAQFSYPFMGSAATLMVQERQTRATFNGYLEATIAVDRSRDRHGNWTTTSVVVDRNNAIRYLRTAIAGSTTVAETEIRGGSVVRERSGAGVTTLFAYDSWGRLVEKRQGTSWEETDPLKLERYSYHPGSDLVSTKGNWASPWAFQEHTLGYDSRNRLIADVDAYGQTKYWKYNERGQLRYQWGSAQHPVRIDYEADYGWMTHMRTYRSGTGWTGSTVPSGFAGGGEATSWTIDPATTLTTHKTDAKGGTVTMEHTARNELRRRILARGGGALHTTYDYDWATGELRSKDHSDSTPDVAFTYGRDGRLVSVTDAAGHRLFEYGSRRELVGEVLPTAYYGSRSVVRSYYTAGEGPAAGRPKKLALGTTGNPWYDGGQNVSQADFAYSPSTGRLDSVSRPSAGGLTREFRYTSEQNDERMNDVWCASVGFRRHIYPQVWRDAPDAVTTTWGSVTIADYVSNYDWLERRVDETISGGIVGALGVAGPVVQAWSYNDRGEVRTEAVSEGGVPRHAKDREYTWDDSWNRATSQTGEDGTTYHYDSPSANRIAYTQGHEAQDLSYDADGNLVGDGQWTYSYDAENQLVAIASPSVAAAFDYDYRGRRIGKNAHGLSAQYFNNTSLSGAPVLRRIDRQIDFPWNGTSPGPGVGANNISVRWEGHVRIPVGGQGTWSFHTDSDDGVRLWINGQNLVNNWTSHGTTRDSGSIYLQGGMTYSVRLDWYQGGGGSVVRLLWSGPGIPSAVVVPSSALVPAQPGQVFVYDETNLLAELDALTLAPVRSYLWGYDVTGGVNRAGGTGGLLMVEVGGQRHYPVFDSRSNVTGLVNESGGIVAAYSYDAFGRTTNQQGSLADTNPMRFSTQYTDKETGLVCFGHRYYSPKLGRFLNRDPIGEAGGVNLYGFCGNDPVNSNDLLGLNDNRPKPYSPPPLGRGMRPPFSTPWTAMGPMPRGANDVGPAPVASTAPAVPGANSAVGGGLRITANGELEPTIDYSGSGRGERSGIVRGGLDVLNIGGGLLVLTAEEATMLQDAGLVRIDAERVRSLRYYGNQFDSAELVRMAKEGQLRIVRVSQAAGSAGYVLTGMNVAIDIYEFRNGDISSGRFLYRTATNTAVVVIAYSGSGGIAAVVAIGAYGGEKFYDHLLDPAIQEAIRQIEADRRENWDTGQGWQMDLLNAISRATGSIADPANP
ncbi:hypothetical protein ASA1KI_03120 [Opitutales bacterium ASA1]|nr:hypothetical protein ASA1KI_03120 [Opitutales bacterium ASA1]